jgi:ATPase subunit of ABC transporter with duplicated ATPase domains
VTPRFVGSVRDAQFRQVRTSSGGEQKRLVLEALLRGPDELLLLDEPDNHLDVPGKRWLEERLAQTAPRKFEEIGPPPEPPRKQELRVRLHGGRTGVRAVTCADLELTGLMQPFSLEVFCGERVAALGSNGSGKSHFLRLLTGEDVAHTGTVKLGACVAPGHFAQRHAHPEPLGRTLVDTLWTEHPRDRGASMSALRW